MLASSGVDVDVDRVDTLYSTCQISPPDNAFSDCRDMVH